MSVLASNQILIGENLQLNGRKADVFESSKPNKRTALGTITNVQCTQKTKSMKKSSSLITVPAKRGKTIYAQQQPFAIHVDSASSELEGQNLEAVVVNLCRSEECIISESAVSPMVVSPCSCDTINAKPDTGNCISVKDVESEYEDDVVKYLRRLQVDARPRVGYMNKQQDINYNMRSILVDWLVEVAEEFKLKDQTLYLAVGYIDRFLSVMSVLRSKLQLVGTACLLLAAKFEEIYAPEVSDFVYITDDTYTSKQLLRMEQLVLKTLNYNLSAPTALEFLEIYLVAAGCRSTVILEEKDSNGDLYDGLSCLARYLCELTLQESSTFLKYLPSTIAAASVSFAARVLGLPAWSEALKQNTGLSEKDVTNCTKDLRSMFEVASTSSQESVRIKYSATKYHQVSKLDLAESMLGLF